MEEYYFLFIIGLVWTLFASIQDLRTREVSNWLNFSLIAIGLSYRGFYSLFVHDATFFLHGLAGFAVFFVFAYALYYARAFAGGDAKLLMGYGTLLPYHSFVTIVPHALVFLLLLFSIGSVYSLIYSAGIVSRNNRQFRREFLKRVDTHAFLLRVSLVFLFASLVYAFFEPLAFALAFAFCLPLLWVYAQSLDACMVRRLSASQLTEGDWILADIRVAKGKIVKKTVHGLSQRDIALLRKYRKSILVKEGIPFVPVFLISFVVMVSVFLFLGQDLLSLFSSLF